MIGDIMQPTHLLFVLAVALLVLGPKRLPEVGRQLGKGIRDFRAAINGEHQDEITAEPQIAPDEPELRQDTAQPVDHQFAHAPVETVPDEHQFAHAPVETVPEEHQFAHAPVETVPEEHQFAHEAAEPAADEHRFAHATSEVTEGERSAAHEKPVQAPAHEVDAGPTRPAGEHEFAYEQAQPAEKPVDPHT
jgi:sec-independent protein translocase protein TatA